jgi:S-formylglutathione hydrolase
VSAFSPIVAPSQVPWGQKAFAAYLGDDRERMEGVWDTCELVGRHSERAAAARRPGRCGRIPRHGQLRPQLLQAAAASPAAIR